MNTAGMPARSARAFAPASALFTRTTAIGRPASISACRFDPVPDARTAIDSDKDHLGLFNARIARLDRSDPIRFEARALHRADRRVRARRLDDRDQAEP